MWQIRDCPLRETIVDNQVRNLFKVPETTGISEIAAEESAEEHITGHFAPTLDGDILNYDNRRRGGLLSDSYEHSI